MRKSSLCVTMALSIFMALCIGTAFAQINATETNTTQTNVTENNASSNNQVLSSTTVQPTKEVLGKNIPGQGGYANVANLTSNISSIFSANPSVDISIAYVDKAQNSVQIANNEAAGSQDLTGWKLVSGGNATYTFPSITVKSGKTITVHEGIGNSTATDLYTNSEMPLWTADEISLVSSSGSTVSTYAIPAVQPQTTYVNPLDSLIQF
jgi:hypothetical protein